MQTNAPLSIPFKKQTNNSQIEKLQKQLHFLEARVKELELTLIEIAEESDEDMSASLDSDDKPLFTRKKAKTGNQLFSKNEN